MSRSQATFLTIASIAWSGMARAQAATIELTPDRWTASDSIRFETYLGRPSLYIDKGVALARGVEFRDGVIEIDIAGTSRSNFAGLSFHARSLDNSEVVFFRFGSSGTVEAIQYAPAANGFGAARQVYHGPGANAVVELPREQWIHIRLVIAGEVATLFVGDAQSGTLTIPRLAGMSGTGLGVWGGNFGRGSYYSNVRYTPAEAPAAPSVTPPLPRGTIVDWQLSQAVDAETFTPAALPRLPSLRWDAVRAEPPGIVLVNRYRVAPAASVPVDLTTGETNGDSVMGGRVKGTKVVFARTVIQADRDRPRRMRFGYSDGVVIYANGTPLYFGMKPPFFRDLGIMDTDGDAVYLPLRKGRNEIVFAVTEYSGGWAYWARLDP